MERTQKPPVVFLDTHVVAWLYDGLVEELSPKAYEVIEAGNLFLPAMAFLELGYLHEIGRFLATPEQVFKALEKDIALKRTEYPFFEIVRVGIHLKWTRDPFDRLIMAETSLAKGFLVSKDQTIRKHFLQAVW